MILLSTKRSSITISFVILSFTLLLLVSIQQQANAFQLRPSVCDNMLTSRYPNPTSSEKLTISSVDNNGNFIGSLQTGIHLVMNFQLSGHYDSSTGRIAFVVNIGPAFHLTYEGYLMLSDKPVWIKWFDMGGTMHSNSNLQPRGWYADCQSSTTPP